MTDKHPEFDAYKRRALRDPRVRFGYYRERLRNWLRGVLR